MSIDAMMLDHMRASGASPHVVGTARALARSSDDAPKAFASWMLAEKFDDQYYVWDPARFASIHPALTEDVMKEAELAVWKRIGYAIPLRTKVSDLYDLLGQDYDEWIYAVLEARWLDLLSPYEWRLAIDAAHRGYFWSLVQLMTFYLSEKTIVTLGLRRKLLTAATRKRKREGSEIE